MLIRVGVSKDSDINGYVTPSYLTAEFTLNKIMLPALPNVTLKYRSKKTNSHQKVC